MKLTRARSCPNVYRRSKKNRNWDGTMKEAGQLLNNLQSSDETSDKPDVLVRETREQKIRSVEKKVNTLGEVIELLEALVENLAVGETLSLEEAERSVERRRHQNPRLRNNNHKSEKRINSKRNLKITIHTKCPICGKTKHEKTVAAGLANTKKTNELICVVLRKHRMCISACIHIYSRNILHRIKSV